MPEGLAEELIDALTHVDGLRVAARSSSFHFRDAQPDIRTIAQRLGVDSVLQGSVRKEGDRVRITVQLVDAPSGYQHWSQRFERTLGDVFAIQDEIATTVVSELRGGALSPRERVALQHPHTAIDTYECYLRGLQSLHSLQKPDLDHSRKMFEQAIALDERYAPAWAGLAMMHAIMFEWWGGHDEDLERADRTSRIAMDLAPDRAWSNVARGLALSLRRCYDEAQACFEAATRINPNQFESWYYYGRACFARGDIARSAELFRRAADVRREDFQAACLLAQSLKMLGRGAEAQAARREGIARAERVLELNPLDGRALSLVSGTLYDDGQTQRALEWSRRSLELYPDDMGALINAACLRARDRQKEEALALIERAFSRGWGKRDWIEHDPDYDILRDDPRFQRLLAQLK